MLFSNTQAHFALHDGTFLLQDFCDLTYNIGGLLSVFKLDERVPFFDVGKNHLCQDDHTRICPLVWKTVQIGVKLTRFKYLHKEIIVKPSQNHCIPNATHDF